MRSTLTEVVTGTVKTDGTPGAMSSPYVARKFGTGAYQLIFPAGRRVIGFAGAPVSPSNLFPSYWALVSPNVMQVFLCNVNGVATDGNFSFQVSLAAQ